MVTPRRFAFAVPLDGAGCRLDRLLATHVDGLSRTQARVLIDIGGVFVDGKRVKVAGRTLRPGQEVRGTIGRSLAQATKATGQAARARDAAAVATFHVVHEDDAVVVVDKPSGLPVAATAETDRGNLAALLSARPGTPRIHVVHRLDAPTSGLLVFAKTVDAARALSRDLTTRTVARAYETVVAGCFPDDVHTIREPIGGRQACTHVRVTERLGTMATRLHCQLETGRTHQIRLHARSVGHPVLGDRLHGIATDHDPPRLALHATTLAFQHPVSGKHLAFASPWPEDLMAWLERLRARDQPRLAQPTIEPLSRSAKETS